MFVFSDKYIMGLQIALEAVLSNKLRSVLTALGIIFGVAAVIAMLAIGKGAKQEILEQMKWIGVNNIVVTPIQKTSATQKNGEKEEARQKAKEQLSLGLRLQDVQAIVQQFNTQILAISAEINNEDMAIYQSNSMSANLSGVQADYFDIYHLEAEKGHLFSTYQYKHAKPVCVIGHQVEAHLFHGESALGKDIKCGSLWLRVVGVLKPRANGGGASAKLQLNDFDKSIFAPAATVLLRYNDRAAISAAKLRAKDNNEGGAEATAESGTKNRNQIDKIVIQVKETATLQATAQLVQKMLLRRHANVEDFNVSVPELLLKQEQKTRSIFNLVLGAIASISLLVGGIGIMNIMLASVMERIREIGVRRAIGATRQDVVFQFLSEATLISVTGGVIGILLGVFIAEAISYFTDIQTIVSFVAILISFGVSVAIGIIFGYMPAQKAAQKDPVSSLRYE